MCMCARDRGRMTFMGGGYIVSARVWAVVVRARARGSDRWLPINRAGGGRGEKRRGGKKGVKEGRKERRKEGKEGR